jgi:hypothetical protein
MPEVDIFRSIAELLRSGSAQPLIYPERVAPSAVYDLNYRISVIALGFDFHAKSESSGNRRIRTALLKLLQFVAVRPWLIPMLMDWKRAEAEPQLSMLTSQKERRGFLTDFMHDHVIEYLVARQVLKRGPYHLGLGVNGTLLTSLSSTLQGEGLFENERSTLAGMKDIKITNNMLEGR